MKAILLNLSAWMLLPFMDGMAKHLSTEIHFIQIVWGRYFFMAILSLLITYFFFNHNLRWPKNLQIQLSRSLFLFLSTVFFFFSISKISLAEALTLSFVSPIIVTILSIFLLNERVGVRRLIAVFLGFAGALIVIRPGFNEINIATVAALGTGICYAFYIVSTRKLSSIDSPLLTLLFTGLSGVILISLVVPFFWTWMNFSQWLILISLASIGTVAHLLIILSLNFAEASKLAPLAYFEIVTNVLIGYYFFNDFPNKWIWVGLLLIISSGIYISIRESIKENLKK